MGCVPSTSPALHERRRSLSSQLADGIEHLHRLSGNAGACQIPSGWIVPKQEPPMLRTAIDLCQQRSSSQGCCTCRLQERICAVATCVSRCLDRSGSHVRSTFPIQAKFVDFRLRPHRLNDSLPGGGGAAFSPKFAFRSTRHASEVAEIQLQHASALQAVLMLTYLLHLLHNPYGHLGTSLSSTEGASR